MPSEQYIVFLGDKTQFISYLKKETILSKSAIAIILRKIIIRYERKEFFLDIYTRSSKPSSRAMRKWRQ